MQIAKNNNFYNGHSHFILFYCITINEIDFFHPCIWPDILQGTWHQIQCGSYVLPHEKDKETAIDGVFFVDPVSLNQIKL